MMIDRLNQYNGVSIVDGEKSFTYKDLSAQIENYYHFLKDSIVENDVIVISSDYTFYSISLFLALAKIPVIVIPIVSTTQEEFENKTAVCFPTKILSLDFQGNINIKITEFSAEYSDDYQEITSKGQTGLVLFSSGTTGNPKVMVQNLSIMINTLIKPKKQRRLVFLLFLLFDHIGGLNTLLSCLNNGSVIVIPKSRKPNEIIRLIKTYEVNVLPTSPTFLNLMMMEDAFQTENLNSLRMITYGTERMPEDLLKRLNLKLPKVKFLQTFGTSETGILKTSSKSSDSLFFKIDDPDREHKVINGELFIRSKTSIKGYKNFDNSNFQEDGWFATGDLVEVDSDGFIKVIGRKNDVINVGGLKVLPSEIEEIINRIEGVQDCTVFGESNAITGNIVCAKIVIHKDLDKFEMKKEIKKVCREKLDKFKVPNKITFSQKIQYSDRFKKI